MQEWHQPTYQRGYRGNRGTAPRKSNSRHGFTKGSKPYRGYNNSDFRSANREYASASSIMMPHSGVTKSPRYHIHPGSVNSELCSVLRDTGCSTVGIKSSFINPEDFTGETATCSTVRNAHFQQLMPRLKRHFSKAMLWHQSQI